MGIADCIICAGLDKILKKLSHSHIKDLEPLVKEMYRMPELLFSCGSIWVVTEATEAHFFPQESSSTHRI